jgi:hypothetical protein
MIEETSPGVITITEFEKTQVPRRVGWKPRATANPDYSARYNSYPITQYLQIG